MRKSVIIASVSLSVVATLAIHACFRQSDAAKRIEKVQIGMSDDEVLAILGPEDGAYADGCSRTGRIVGYWDVQDERIEVMFHKGKVIEKEIVHNPDVQPGVIATLINQIRAAFQ